MSGQLNPPNGFAHTHLNTNHHIALKWPALVPKYTRSPISISKTIYNPVVPEPTITSSSTEFPVTIREQICAKQFVSILSGKFAIYVVPWKSINSKCYFFSLSIVTRLKSCRVCGSPIAKMNSICGLSCRCYKCLVKLPAAKRILAKGWVRLIQKVLRSGDWVFMYTHLYTIYSWHCPSNRSPINPSASINHFCPKARNDNFWARSFAQIRRRPISA